MTEQKKSDGHPPFCDFCKAKRCSRRSKIPYGPPNLRLYKRICSNCLIHNMRRVRIWMEDLEKEFE